MTDEPTPGGPNHVVEPVVCEPSEDWVRINELLPDPEGDDAGGEFVELFNPGPDLVSVAGWSLWSATSTFNGPDVVLGAGMGVPRGGFLVLGGADVPQADVIGGSVTGQWHGHGRPSARGLHRPCGGHRTVRGAG